MPHIHYGTVSGASVDHLRPLESFLDDNHHKMSQELHEELKVIYEEVNDHARSSEGELQDRIDELEVKIAELDERIEQMQQGEEERE